MGAPWDVGGKIIAAFRAGAEERRQQQQLEQQQEERKLRQANLKLQQDHLKHEQAIEDWKLKYGAAQDAAKMQSSQMAPEVPAVPAQPAAQGLTAIPGASAAEVPGGYIQPPPVQTPGMPELGIEAGSIPVVPLQEQLMQMALKKQMENSAIAPEFSQGAMGVVQTKGPGAGKVATPAPAKPATAGAGRTITTGGRIKQFNPQTGQYDIDAGPAQPSTDKSVTPYEDYRAKGGTPEGWLKLQGQNRPQAQMPPLVKKDFATLASTDKLLDSIGAEADKHPEWIRGSFLGVNKRVARYNEQQGNLSKDEELFRKKVKQNLVEQLHQLSGAAISPTEAERLLQALPNVEEMSAVEFKSAVSAAKDFIRRKQEGLLAQFANGVPTAEDAVSPSPQRPAGVPADAQWDEATQNWVR